MPAPHRPASADLTRRRFVALSCAAGVALPLAATEEPAFVMGTPRPPDTVVGDWLRLIYIEAFRRIGMPVRFETHPVKRLVHLLASGQIDGETARAADFAQGLPDVMRIDESVFDTTFMLFASRPQLALQRLEDLPATGWRGVTVRGLVECERALRRWLPVEQLADVALTEQAVKMVQSGRADFLCALDVVVLSALHAPEFRGTPPLHKLAPVGAPVPLYPFVHRRRAPLAPRLGAALAAMKAEGLIDRLLQDATRRISVR